ncbi:MAG: carbohydrate binding family 9 domain-containing protein [Saprospiraceae bacterium]|nr:carbohydrate binding family 9 domain-containing protein [Saprospiraceae bacterium]
MHRLFTSPLFYLTLIALFFPGFVFAQTTRAEQQSRFTLNIARAPEAIRVDGDLSEPVWQSAAVATDFLLKWPRDGAPAPQQTEVRCAYDDRFLYIGVVCLDTTPEYVIQSLKRDVGYWDSDGFAVVIDPSNAAGNGYFFGISPNGVQTEGLISSGSEEIDFNWDNTWVVETRNYADRWTAELAIPLRILRFKEGQTTWGINFIRNDLTNGLYSVWAQVPFQFDGTDLGWTGALQWDVSPRRTKGNYNIIPYTRASFSADYEEDGALEVKPGAGLDAKIGIGSALNLDLTLNPDFSQVEIDEQVVNLTRFDVQLPEKRTFFLENADLFANFGIPPIRPFFSRRIGLDDDGNPLSILGGLRLTGNVGSDTRIGLLSMQTKAGDSIPSRNFTAVAVNRRLFGRSTVSGYFLDREDFDGSEIMKNRYSRNAGLEFLFTSNDGKWLSWLTHHRSFKPGISNKNWWGNAGFAYKNRHVKWLLDYLHMGENYYADLGFERRIENEDVARDTTLRIGYTFIYSEFGYRFFHSEQSRMNYTEIGGEVFVVLNPDGTLNECSPRLGMEMNFKNTSEISFNLSPSWLNVPVSFKFDDSDDLTDCPPLPAGSYRYLNGSAEWTSDYRKRFFISVEGGGGGFYNGRQYSANVGVSWRIRSIANIRMAAEYNLLDFPAPYCDVELLNLTPRFEIFFAKNLWWTTFLQYNTQSDNFNVNSRLQWRFRPMSDVFVVYTDNYAVKFWGPKNRALVLKVNYWL